MNLSKKQRMKCASICLAFGLAVTSTPLWQIPLSAKAAEQVYTEASELCLASKAATSVTLESVRAEAAASYTSDKKGFDLDLSGQTFSGTGLTYSDNADMMSVLNNLRTGKDDQTIIIRFKTSQSGNMTLFGAGTSGNATDGSTMLIGLSGGKLRLGLRNDLSEAGSTAGKSSNGLRGSFGDGLADGDYHTVAISFLSSLGSSENNVRIVIDGGSELYSSYGWYASWISGFNTQVDKEYQSLEIGTANYYDNTSAMSAFQGDIDFITLTNKGYTTEELQTITSGDKDFTDISNGMFTSGTANTWIVTGGTEAVADFSVNKTTRNWVALFEDTMRDAGSYIERSKFVFNTAKRGETVAKLLEEYDTRIAAFGTNAVAVMVGKDDYSQGSAGLEEFKSALTSLIAKIKSENKYPVLLTPYPSQNAADNANIATYVAAMKEVAGDTTVVVDLTTIDTSYVQADGTLTSLGHQAVANAIKTAVGVSGKSTSYGLNLLSDGDYTIAKTDENGDLAALQSVTAGSDSISVAVDPSSISGEKAALTYQLTDSKGTIRQGSAAAGATSFKVDGLESGETYTLEVFDCSRGNVTESYEPETVTTVEGASGVLAAYEDENTGVNEKIQSLLSGDDPVTYLFMGDSITHGVVTLGYDNVPQMFAKYLDEIGRSDDIVLNTGVSNATLLTTLDQVEQRLTRYDPDVVMIMLGTNDCSPNGQNTFVDGSISTCSITVDEYKERYKELIRDVYENNPETVVVLRVPCDLSYTTGRTTYESFFDSIPEIAKEIKAEIPDLNITVVNHLEAWRDYRDNVRNDNISTWSTGTTYGWLCNDGIHPNGRGNIAMFQQIIKELGIYDNTSEIANYTYALNDWTGTSTVAATVTQKATRASFSMGTLSEYANGLKDVTVALKANGTTITKTAAYDVAGTISLNGLDPNTTYEVKVTGKDATDSKEITFAATLEKAADESATHDEVKEVTDTIAKVKEEIASYPKEIQETYLSEVENVEASVEKGSLSITEVDSALATLRTASAKAKAAAEEAEKAAAESANRVEEKKETAETAVSVGSGTTEDHKVSSNSVTYVQGKTYPSGNFNYKITDVSKGTVEIVGLANQKLTKIVVKSTVKLGGKTYKITSIAASAFKNNKKITSVTIGKNVEKIGAKAFYGCKNLKKVTVKSKVLKSVGKKALKGTTSKAVIKVPSAKAKAYKKLFAKSGMSKKAVVK